MSTPDRYVRIVGYVRDTRGGRLAVGVDYDAVTIGQRRLEPHQAAEFARLYVDACMQAARQGGELTGAQLAELRAAREEMCLADCKAPEQEKTA
jgi:hypothetical protein